MFNRRHYLNGAFASAATLSAGLHIRPLFAANDPTARGALVDCTVTMFRGPMPAAGTYPPTGTLLLD